MLVLSKKPGEKLVIDQGATVTVMEALNGQVKLGVGCNWRSYKQFTACFKKKG